MFQLPDGRWRGTLSLGYRNGKRLRKSLEAPTLAELHERLTQAKCDLQHGINIAPERMTLDALLSQWLEVKKADLAPVCQLELVHRNVALLVNYPQVAHREMGPWLPEQAKRFLAAAQQDRLGALFMVGLAIGTRKGESLGLKWPDIDFNRCWLSIQRAMQRIKLPGIKQSRLILREPKRGSRRTIVLPQVLVAALRTHHARQLEERRLAGARWQETGFVFTTESGTPIDPRNVNRAFFRICEKAGLPQIRVHDLRHTCASLLCAQRVSLNEIEVILGHSDIRITANLYAHLYPEAGCEPAAQMDALLNPVAQVPGSGALVRAAGK
jgi:integrase